MRMAESTSNEDPRTWAYHASLWCGGVPLLLGVCIFLLFWATGARWLISAGVITIALGAAANLVGWVCLCVDASGSRRWTRSVLLAANWPVAGVLVLTCIFLTTRYSVTIKNVSEHPVEVLRIVGGGIEEQIGVLLPGEETERSLWFTQEGELKLELRHVSGILSHEIEGYVGPAGGGDIHVSLHSDGSVRVRSPT